MIFTINAKEMRSAIERSAYARKSSLPILGCVELWASAESVTVRATDLDTESEFMVPAILDRAGSCVVEAKSLLDFLKSCKSSSVNFHLEDGTLHGSSGNASRKFVTYEEFPEQRSIKGFEYVGRIKDVSDVVKRIKKHVSTDLTRPTLCCAFLTGTSAAACDSYRLAVLDGVYEGGDALLNRDLFPYLEKYKGEDAEVYVTDDYLKVLIPGVAKYETRRITGKYPDFKRLFPEHPNGETVIDRDALLGALRSVGGQAVTLNATGQVCDVSNESACVSVESETTGLALRVQMNRAYLTDALNALDGDEARFVFTGRLKPVIIKGGDTKALIMPVRGLEPTEAEKDEARECVGKLVRKYVKDSVPRENLSMVMHFSVGCDPVAVKECVKKMISDDADIPLVWRKWLCGHEAMYVYSPTKKETGMKKNTEKEAVANEEVAMKKKETAKKQTAKKQDAKKSTKEETVKKQTTKKETTKKQTTKKQTAKKVSKPTAKKSTKPSAKKETTKKRTEAVAEPKLEVRIPYGATNIRTTKVNTFIRWENMPSAKVRNKLVENGWKWAPCKKNRSHRGWYKPTAEITESEYC